MRKLLRQLRICSILIGCRSNYSPGFAKYNIPQRSHPKSPRIKFEISSNVSRIVYRH
jgi:hypothetical protein